MGRLHDIVARNQTQQRRTSRTLLWVGVGVVAVVLAIVLAFTGLGMPKRPPAVEKRVDGVLLRSH